MNSSKRDWRMPSGIWLLVLAIATFAIYCSGLNIWYYGDDFQYLYEDPASRILHFFYNPNLFHGFYRPVNSAIIAVVQLFFGLETWPIHLINILVHALLAWMIFLFMKRERFSTWQGVLASAFMVFSQENASAILSNDTFSQISGTFFGCVALWFLYRGYFRTGEDSLPTSDPEDGGAREDAPGRFPVNYYLLALLAFVISLASKETSIAFGPMIFCFFVIKNCYMPGWASRLMRSAIEVLPFLILALLYVWVRAAIGLSQPTGTSGGYGFGLGLNVFENLAQFLFAAIVPVSSATAFVAVKNRDIVQMGGIILGSLIFLGCVLYGLVRSEGHRSIPVMGLLTLLGLVPAIFMNHVGELYLYNSMPFISVLVGAGLGTMLERSRGKRPAVLAFWLFMGVLVTSHIIAIQSKAANMRLNGERAARYLQQIKPLVAQVPENGTLLLLNPDEWHEPEYSVFLMKPFSVFKWGVHVIKQETDRWDMIVEVIEKDEVHLPQYRENALILGLEGDSVVVRQEP